jgi:hypothetical protein
VATPLVLYSTKTWLSFWVAEQYYNGIHYAWCSPYFDARALPSYQASNPPSSNPSEIYAMLKEAVHRNDQHCAKISDNKVGIINGANYKNQSRIITDQQQKDIAALVAVASTRDFRPLLFVIPHNQVVGIVKEVPIPNRANPFSVEYVIECLPRNCFDVIELP